jgi:DNA-directed RNA polymerase subunit RPC12/RpoP
MIDPTGSRFSKNISNREYENLLREGIHAVKDGRLTLARRLLNRAAAQNPQDARVWLWLSGTTEDPQERRKLLEKAVGADPYNTAARKGLALLEEQLGPSLYEPAEPAEIDRLAAGSQADQAVPAGTVSYDCPQCGGRLNFQLGENDPVCESCGYIHLTAKELAADEAEKPIVHVMHQKRAHSWAASQLEVECEKCGAHTLEPPGKKTTSCPYCGSNQLIESSDLKELLDPQVIALFKIDSSEAHHLAREWLNTGLFAPDDLQQQVKKLGLRPAYYPFWTLDGSVEISWSAEVRDPGSQSPYREQQWRYTDGVVVEFFDDILVSGVSSLDHEAVAAIEPFNLKDVIAFDPDHLAGWPAMYYDRPLSEASMLARQRVVSRLRPRVRRQVAPGLESRNIQIGGGNWSGVTFKHVLLPIWVGTYTYKKDTFHVLVNGQNGKVGGAKPRDPVKLFGIWAIVAFLALGLLALIVWWAWTYGPALLDYFA